MVNYKDLGLVNTREMFKKAVTGGYAIPAFNFNTMEQMQAIVQAAVETKSPVIMQVSKGARNYANATILRYMAEGAVAYAKELGCPNPEIVLHLDHGDSFELCKDCIDMGFSSVMIDGSSLPYEENVALTKKVVDYAHQFDVTVEAELGVLAGVEDEVVAAESHYTKPEEVIDFATRTGCDSLAISIGTSHGAHKFTPEQCTLVNGVLVPPPLAFDVLAEIEKKLPGFPIVLHGSSSVPMEEVETINKYGGHLEAAIGIPEEQLRKAAKSAVCKINIDSDSRLAMTAAIRKHLAEHPGDFDPRQYLKPARENMKKMYIHKIVNVLGSEDSVRLSFLLCVHVGMNLVDRTCGGVKCHVGDVTLEESTATQFDKAKLTGIDIKGGQLLLFTMERQTDAAWHIDIEATILFVLRSRILLGVGAMQVFYTHIIRYT